MKRTSILVLIACVMTQQIAIASYNQRVRYSMYAFSHDSSGLVPGYVKYSPYAFGINKSGLVNQWTRYSPYASGINHDGLISEWGSEFSPYGVGSHGDQDQQKLTKAIDRLSQSIDHMKSPCRTNGSYTYRASRGPTYSRQSVCVEDFASDNPRLLMRAILNTLIPGQYRVSQLLRVDQEVVSFNVVIENRNLIIKYWNPAKIQSIKQGTDKKTEQLSDYMKAWAAAENFYDNHGERVVHIVSADQEDIILELANCLQTETM